MVRAVTDAITELFRRQTQAGVLALALELGHVTGLTESCTRKEQTEAIAQRWRLWGCQSHLTYAASANHNITRNTLCYKQNQRPRELISTQNV